MSQRTPNGFLGDNYPRNMWWVAARTDELTTTPLARWILEMPVVLYRTESGEPVALDDRCPHRWAPLSEGQVEGEELRCPYHGMRFGTDGANRFTKTRASTIRPAFTLEAAIGKVGQAAFAQVFCREPTDGGIV